MLFKFSVFKFIAFRILFDLMNFVFFLTFQTSQCFIYHYFNIILSVLVQCDCYIVLVYYYTNYQTYLLILIEKV